MALPNAYGTLRNFSTDRPGAHAARPDEEQPLLGEITPKYGWRESMMVNVDRDRADLILLLCYIITGILDSVAIITWGSFVSMQTGNTVYIGLGLAAPTESNRWIKSGTALIFFCIGSFCFSRFHRYFMPCRRWVLCASFLAQTGLIVAAAAILTWGPISTNQKDAIGWDVLVPIALVSFQSCGQAVTSRALKFNALTSVVLTSIYCDLFSDVELFALHNVERNRRVGAPVLLLFGAVIGGLVGKSAVGSAGALWMAAGLKSAVIICWYLWPAVED